MRRYWSIGWLLCALVVMAAPIVSRAQLLSITIAPPELPVYEQPAIPEPGYIWTPGYWAYGPDGYYWVPGTWVEPPSVGVLWTPGYWGWQDGNYGWNDGYWGQQIGFYGGVDYGYGYGGDGYQGGYWDNGVFAYNRTVNNFGGVAITHVYEKTVITNTNATRASFNGGSGGTSAKPTAREQAAGREKHVPATPLQTQHQHTASTNKALLASVNHGSPAIAATSKPGEFAGKGVVPAKAGSGAVPATLAKPTAAPAGAVAPAGAAALEKKQPIGTVHPATTTAIPPKTDHAHSKPLATVSEPKPAVVKPPPPPRTAAVKPAPHPAAVARPAAVPHPVAARPPPPAPHPAAPKPAAAKPPPPKKPPPPH